MSFDLDLSIAAFSEFVDGVLQVAVDRYGESQQSGASLPSVQPLGILSRPLDPTTDPVTKTPVAGASCLFAFDGDSGDGFSMPTTDARLVKLVPEIAKGATVLYSAGPWLLLDEEAKNVMLRQPIGTDKSQVIAMSGVDGEEQIQVRHLKGGGIACLPDGSVLINAETASNFVQIKNDGVTISGLLSLAGGAVLGDTVGAKPVALAPEIAIWATTVNVALTAIATLLNAPGPVIGAPGAVVPPPPLSPTFIATKVAAS